jgi:hypothetical protein
VTQRDDGLGNGIRCTKQARNRAWDAIFGEARVLHVMKDGATL